MNWREIKEEAKQKIKGNLWVVWKPAIVIGLITSIITAVITAAFGEESDLSGVLTSILSLALIPMEVGYSAYMLKFVRGEKYSLDDLKAYYKKFLPLLLLEILVGILVTLGFVALVIPGVILALAYSMVFYIFIEDPELETTEYLKRSREMMKGYKGNYLGFMLSFIGWILLCILIIPAIWIVPYISTAEVLYYDKLKNATKTK